MRVRGWVAQHRRLRIALTILLALIVVGGIARLWTWWPDTVQITVIQMRADGSQPVVLYDRTIHDAAFAQRLQHEADGFAVYTNPLASTTCAIGFSAIR